MLKIPLRAYNREINDLIENKKAEEGIAHCKHILKSFPKHIDTYRLLGRLFLELEQYNEASDIFQRILAAIPDDFTAQVGMAAVREAENNLDAAIWHIERAFEVQPSNPTIQNELRRFYQLRDEISPPKIRLTRGALVRMYARGELYPQAIAESSAVLSEEPQRIDIELIHAQMHYQMGHKSEALALCEKIIEKAPHCFEANRILSELLPEFQRHEEAEIYRKRIHELDPYTAFLSEQFPNINQVPDGSITIGKLEFQSIVESEPSVLSDLENVPDWMEEASFISSDEARIADEPLPIVSKTEWIDPSPLEEINVSRLSNNKIEEADVIGAPVKPDPVDEGFAWLESVTNQNGDSPQENNNSSLLSESGVDNAWVPENLLDESQTNASDIFPENIESEDIHPSNAEEFPNNIDDINIDTDFDSLKSEDIFSLDTELNKDIVSASLINETDEDSDGFDFIELKNDDQDVLIYDNLENSQAHIDQLIKNNLSDEQNSASQISELNDDTVQKSPNAPDTTEFMELDSRAISDSKSEIEDISDISSIEKETPYLNFNENGLIQDVDIESTEAVDMPVPENNIEQIEPEEVEAAIDFPGEEIIEFSKVEDDILQTQDDASINKWVVEAESGFHTDENIDDQSSDIEKLLQSSSVQSSIEEELNESLNLEEDIEQQEDDSSEREWLIEAENGLDLINEEIEDQQSDIDKLLQTSSNRPSDEVMDTTRDEIDIEQQEDDTSEQEWLIEAENGLGLISEEIEDQQSDIDKLLKLSPDDSEEKPEEVSYPVSEEEYLTALKDLEQTQQDDLINEITSIETQFEDTDKVAEDILPQDAVSPPPSPANENLISDDISSDESVESIVPNVIPEWFIEDITSDESSEPEGELPEWVLETDDQILESQSINPQEMVDKLFTTESNEEVPEWVEESDLSSYSDIANIDENIDHLFSSTAVLEVDMPDEEQDIIMIDDAALPEWVKDIYLQEDEFSSPVLPSLQRDTDSEWIPEMQAIQTRQLISIPDIDEVKEDDNLTLPSLDEINVASQSCQDSFDIPAPDTSTSIESVRKTLGKGNLRLSLDQYHNLILSKNKLNEIIEDLENLKKQHPFEASVWHTLGDAYAKNNQLKLALDAYSKAEELLH